MDSEIENNGGAHGDGAVRSMKCSATDYNKNTCPGCGGPGQKHPDETLYHCPNNWCDVKLFQPRTQPARGESSNDALCDGGPQSVESK